MTDDRERGREDASASEGEGRAEPSAGNDPAAAASTDEPTAAAAGNDPSADDEVPAGTAGRAPADDGRVESWRQRRRREKREKKAKPRRKAPWWEFPLLIAIAIGIAILVKTFVIQPFYIPSDSMEKTLHGCEGCSGDRILVNKPVYSVIRDPQPGDIVVFDAPDGWQNTETVSRPPGNPVVRVVRGFGQLIGFVPPDGEVLVKRVIAVGGQTVKGDAQGHVMISTKGRGGPYRTLDEPYVYAPVGEAGQQPFGPVTVPKDRLWVMGDHRTDSADSRYHCSRDGQQGTSDDLNCDRNSSTVPVDDVIGKAIVIAWPPSRWTTLGTPSTFESSAALAGPGLPAVASLATIVPVALVRRRRRR